MENSASFPHSHTTNKQQVYLIRTFKKRTCIVHLGLTEPCIGIVGFTHKSV